MSKIYHQFINDGRKSNVVVNYSIFSSIMKISEMRVSSLRTRSQLSDFQDPENAKHFRDAQKPPINLILKYGFWHTKPKIQNQNAKPNNLPMYYSKK